MLYQESLVRNNRQNSKSTLIFSRIFVLILLWKIGCEISSVFNDYHELICRLLLLITIHEITIVKSSDTLHKLSQKL